MLEIKKFVEYVFVVIPVTGFVTELTKKVVEPITTEPCAAIPPAAGGANVRVAYV